MLPSSNFTRKVSHGESPAQLPSHPALLGQRGHPFVPFVPCGEPDAAPSTTASAPNAHVSDLGHTRLARSNLPVLYTIGTVSAMPFIHERHGKRIQTLLTWVLNFSKGLFRQRATFSSDFLAKLQFFLGTFGGIESIARLQTFFITGRRLFRSMA